MKRFNNLPYHLGLKVRIYPNYRQKAIIKANSNAYRYWYNRQLGLDYYQYEIKSRYGLDNSLINRWYDSIYDKRKLTYAKQLYPWLKNKKIDSLACNSAYLNHKQAWKNYRNGLQHKPTYHAKKRHPYLWRYQTSCVGKSVQIIDKNHIKIPKLKRVRTSKIRDVILNKSDLRFGRITITKDNTDQSYASFQLGSMTPFVTLDHRSSELASLGYDLNTSNFLMDSNTDYVGNPRYYEKAEKKLHWLQHCLSRKYRHNSSRRLRDCKDYQKNRRAVAHVKKHVKNQRFNFLQRLSTKLIENQDFLVGENLKSKNMLKNHRIAKSIQSVGWRSFIGMLAYKAILYHKIYVLVNPAYTTQKCSNCGYVCSKKDGTHLDLSDRQWTCPKCGAHHIRDVNASINILNSGIKQILGYLPKSVRTSVRMATDGHKLVQCNHHWLQYLVTHYYGVLDETVQHDAKLVRED